MIQQRDELALRQQQHQLFGQQQQQPPVQQQQPPDDAMTGPEERKGPPTAEEERNIVDQYCRRFVAQQCNLMVYHLGAAERDNCVEINDILLGLRCGVCDMIGHASPQCWYNGALYEECRRLNMTDLNYEFRSAIKLAGKQETLTRKQEAEKEALKMESDMRLQV